MTTRYYFDASITITPETSARVGRVLHRIVDRTLTGDRPASPSSLGDVFSIAEEITYYARENVCVAPSIFARELDRFVTAVKELRQTGADDDLAELDELSSLIENSTEDGEGEDVRYTGPERV